MVTRGLLPLASGTADLCSELGKQNEEVMTRLKFAGLPTECPFPKVKPFPLTVYPYTANNGLKSLVCDDKIFGSFIKAS